MGATVRRAAWLAKRIEQLTEGLAMVSVVVMVLATGYQVFGRYLLGRSPAWSEELARYLMVWLTFLGATAVLRSGGHLTVSAFFDVLATAGRRRLLWIRDALMLSLCLTLCWASGQFAWLNRAQESAAMEIPMTVANGALTLGFGLLALQIVLARLAGMPFKAIGEGD